MSRPAKEIDWKKVDDLLMAGCLGTEICPHFDMHPNTFYDRVVQKYGMSFTDYSTQKRSHGDSILRAVQYNEAVKGDKTLLIWLGKVRLEQREVELVDRLVPRGELLLMEDELIRLRKEIRELRELKDVQPQTGT